MSSKNNENDTMDVEETTQDDEVVPVDNLLQLADAQYKSIQHENVISTSVKQSSQNFIESTIRDNNMYPYVQFIKKHSHHKYVPNFSDEDLNAMKEKNEKKLKEINEKLVDAQENLGDIEVRDALYEMAKYYHSIGDRDNAIKYYKESMDKTVATSQKLDYLFSILRIGFSLFDTKLLKTNLEEANRLVEIGGDWDHRNRLKVYEGVFNLCVRNFDKSAELFLDSIATFGAYEMMSYKTLIYYTIIASCISLERPDLKKKVIDSPEVLSVINQLPTASKIMNSLYNCEYREFLSGLADVSDEFLKDRYLHPHFSFYSREMRIRAYSQYLESYKSVTLDNMSMVFGVSSKFIDRELSKFIAASRLSCKIDKVAGVIESDQTNPKNINYLKTIKHGDLLLNRVQKLSRVIDL